MINPNETTEAHPNVPDGPWRLFADCPECGAHRGFGCCDTTGSPGRRLGYAHTTRQLDVRPETADDIDEDSCVCPRSADPHYHG